MIKFNSAPVLCEPPLSQNGWHPKLSAILLVQCSTPNAFLRCSKNCRKHSTHFVQNMPTLDGLTCQLRCKIIWNLVIDATSTFLYSAHILWNVRESFSLRRAQYRRRGRSKNFCESERSHEFFQSLHGLWGVGQLKLWNSKNFCFLWVYAGSPVPLWQN